MKFEINKIRLQPRHKKIILWTLGILGALLIVGGITAYFMRESVFQKVLTRAIQKADRDYHVKLAVQKSGFTGLSTVYLENLTVVPENRDTLVNIADLKVSVKIFPLLFGQIKLSDLHLNKGLVQIVKRDSLSNIDFLFKKKDDKNTDSLSKRTPLSEIANNLLNEILYKIPDDMAIQDFKFLMQSHEQVELALYSKKSNIINGNLDAEVIVDGNFATWKFTGKLKPGKKRLSLNWEAKDGPVELPLFLQQKFNGALSFDKIQTELKDAYFSGGNFEMLGSWAIQNLKINQARIAQNDIFIRKTAIDAQVVVGDDWVALGEDTKVYLKDAILRPYVKYTLRPHKIYELKLAIDKQPAQALVEAFPEGLFDSLDGMQVAGNITYNLDFLLDSQEPDSVHFESSLVPENFKLLKWGKTDLSKINQDFIYTPYEYGKPMRNIVIGRANPNFTPLESVSDNFKNAILTSEDPSFFTHKGFVEQAFRNSIATNFKEKGFKRGGSTISMQLVKNVFLNRNKTISRKVEEILIVWLIENNRIVSKNRMLEVYFNIIEMGNNVYGIGEAAQYYFGKSPSELSVGEGIFLANIVPRPKVALYKFMSDGHLKPYLLNYFNFIGNTMARRGKIAPDSNAYGFYNVRIREGLRAYLLPDSVEIDTNSLDLEEEDEALNIRPNNSSPRTILQRIFTPPKDTLVIKKDTVKTRKQLRQERRQNRNNPKSN
ncbi:MAG: penicillin-binding protein [Pedobacter sp.]|nr:MAG: penicillin-binding protein [Pedobacter sp.]